MSTSEAGWFGDVLADLLLGGSCVGCARRGRTWCSACAADLLADDGPLLPGCRPAPTTHPVPRLRAAAAYAGAVPALVVGHKERGLPGPRAPLAGLLAAAVEAVLEPAVEAVLEGSASDDRPAPPLLLVPVPSRPSAVRARGRDATADLARATAGVLRRRGRRVAVARLLRTRPGLRDQGGLDAAARAQNLDRGLAAPAHLLARQARRRPAVSGVVVCDDVVTTGSTLAAAARVLHGVGLPVLGCATAAATARTAASPTSGARPGSSR
ncbi:ComF family protein [Nocardioides bruguierae]|uniref:ComF family protein n=1 Tax=Nocardioides bruguierae TaxID=2945102 RepID=UPI00202004FD|nr:phosphoribosyltransferase family protein [Nocardioides bruguierae]MCL8024963.1 ComF family protein [Nocardioides bruguierae]